LLAVADINGQEPGWPRSDSC